MSLVLITGATGFIGSQVALHVLDAGYRVRLVIRRPEQADKLRRVLAHDEQIEFSIVPDITVSGAFDSSLQDVQYIMHVASPIPSGGSADLLTPAVRGTLSILESAAKFPSVKKVVITASVLSLVSLGGFGSLDVVRETNAIDYTVDPEKVPSLDPMGQYHASKLASYKATIDFVDAQRPSFDVVTLHPVLVFGRSLIQDNAADLDGSNGMLFQTLVSEQPEQPFMNQYLGVHVLDVADAHVKALDEKIKGFESYLLAAERRTWAEVETFVKKELPEFPLGWKNVPETAKSYTVDAGKARRELGMEFKGMERQVGDLVRQQMELRGKGV
jgi:nucleoside-diphosphate-sugar epimerase